MSRMIYGDGDVGVESTTAAATTNVGNENKKIIQNGDKRKTGTKHSWQSVALRQVRH